MMKENESENNYLWCLHCERTYKIGEHRTIDDLDMCPYEGCDGDVVWDGMSWTDMCEHYPEYPVVPLKGMKYPQ